MYDFLALTGLELNEALGDSSAVLNFCGYSSLLEVLRLVTRILFVSVGVKENCVKVSV